MAKFTIKDQDTSIPMLDTHYYQWLKETNQTTINKTITKVEYLKSQGFIVGTDFISDKEIFTLKSIENIYYTIELSPKVSEIIAKF